MRTVLYSCPFVPAEWIAAHGLRPRRIASRPASRGDGRAAWAPPEGACPYAHAFLRTVEEEEAADAVVFTTTCDQMRRAAECLDDARPGFLLNVPTTWRQASAQQYYLSELERLGRFLVRLGGSAPSDEKLAEVMDHYDTARATLRNARTDISARDFAEAIRRFNEEGPESLRDLEENAKSAAPVRFSPSQPRIALAGVPLMDEGVDLFGLIERSGARVALDATETGERTLPGAIDRRRFRQNPLLELADIYFGAIPDIARRPNSGFFQWLRDQIEARAVQGLILPRYPWCDLWHAETFRIKEWASIPVLDLDLGPGERNGKMAGRTETRIEAFVEMLS